MAPSPDDQIRFPVNIQRLLDEGSFVATYKFALLLALAELAIERGDDSGAPLPLSTDDIAEKFVQFYWRHTVPYAAASKSRILRQNTGKQAAIINLVERARATHRSVSDAMHDKREWNQLVRKVATVVRVMPLWNGRAGSARLPVP
jgi:hypothetical protein